jgi:hypothetical protein
VVSEHVPLQLWDLRDKFTIVAAELTAWWVKLLLGGEYFIMLERYLVGGCVKYPKDCFPL